MNTKIICLLSLLVGGLAVTRSVDVPTSQLPTLFLIGDSTVKNGSGKGDGGLWGWGQVLPSHFDTRRIQIENRALGGRSSRTFFTEGLWNKVVADLHPGDYVLMQFGHNDSGEMAKGDRPRASIKGNGEETVDVVIEKTGRRETVHSYGWYLRKYIADARSKGAIPIVLSPVPRNQWKGDTVIRAENDYAKWAAAAAQSADVPFIPLNDSVARHYEADGQTVVARDYFTAKDHTHTTLAGAKINAQCVAEGIRGLKGCQLRDFLAAEPARPSSRAAETAPVPTVTAARVDGSRTFIFGNRAPTSGETRVLNSVRYSQKTGFGFELGADAMVSGAEGVFSEKPFLFSVALPEGNYSVTVRLGGDPDRDAIVTVKSESRRLMLEGIPVPKGKIVERSFAVNVRTPEIKGGDRVRLKERERGCLHWDEKLTLEFNGTHPSVSRIAITPAPESLVTVWLTGDSTVTDQPFEPWNSWGQMLPRFFNSKVAVANHAESGESIRSSLSARRFDKVFASVRGGGMDWVFFQFGHNDMKDRSPDALDTYCKNLRQLVETTRKKGAFPVLVTSMERKSGVDRDTLAGYPDAVRGIAREMDVPLIDLHAMSRQLYKALGPELDKAFQDGTHHNNYGSYELARCVVEGIRKNVPNLARFIAEDVPPFDPARPDPPALFTMPPSPNTDRTKPDGN